MEWHRGHIFHVTGSPDVTTATDALVHVPDGAVLVDGAGVIAWSGPWAARPDVPGTVTDHHGAFLLPGFVDVHLHFPQVHCVDAYGGGQLLSWLEHVVFAAEARLADPDAARDAADLLCDRLVSSGTTTAMVFGSQFPHAQECLVDEVRARGLRMVTGRTVMTTGPAAAAPLLTDDRTAERLIRDEVERWHPPAGVDALVRVAIVPRFAMSVEPSTLAMLGRLVEEYADRGVHVTTHLSESVSEAAAVRERFGVGSYLDAYDGRFLPGSRAGGASLLGPRTVLAHAVHCSPAEFGRIAEAGASIAHCPVSQEFLGSGVLPWLPVVASGANVAIGSDIAAGDEWFIPRVLNAAYKAHMNEPSGTPVVLEPAQLLFLGTLAGARALGLDGRIGNLDPGKDADLVVLDPDRCPELADLMDAPDVAEGDGDGTALLFHLLMGARESAVSAVYVRGRRLGEPVGSRSGVGRAGAGRSEGRHG